MVTLNDIKNLKKEDLQKLVIELLNVHETYFKSAKEVDSSPHTCFFMHAGACQAIRERYNVPLLYNN